MVDFGKYIGGRKPDSKPAPRQEAADPTKTHYADEYEWEEDEREDERREREMDEMSDGCCFPGECCMPGPHLRSDCHTAEMIEDYERGTKA